MAEFKIDKVEIGVEGFEGKFLGVLKVKPDYVVENTTIGRAIHPDPVPEQEFRSFEISNCRSYLEKQPLNKRKSAIYFLRIFDQLEVSMSHCALTDEFLYRDVDSLTRHLRKFAREGLLSELLSTGDSWMDKSLGTRSKTIYILTALQHAVCNMHGQPNRRLTSHLYG